MRLENIKLNRIKIFLQNVPGIIAEHIILVFLCLIFLNFGIAGILFYRYSILTEKVIPEVIRGGSEFKEKVEQEILREWEDREKKFKKVDFKVYLNPFLEKREILKPLPIEEERSEKQEEQKPEEPKEEPAEQKTEIPQGARTLFEFYTAKGENLPSIEERAKLWEKLGLGKAEEYEGLYSQNVRLLEWVD